MSAELKTFWCQNMSQQQRVNVYYRLCVNEWVTLVSSFVQNHVRMQRTHEKRDVSARYRRNILRHASCSYNQQLFPRCAACTNGPLGGAKCKTWQCTIWYYMKLTETLHDLIMTNITFLLDGLNVTDWRQTTKWHNGRMYQETRSSAIAERPRDALCCWVFSLVAECCFN